VCAPCRPDTWVTVVEHGLWAALLEAAEAGSIDAVTELLALYGAAALTPAVQAYVQPTISGSKSGMVVVVVIAWMGAAGRALRPSSAIRWGDFEERKEMTRISWERWAADAAVCVTRA